MTVLNKLTVRRTNGETENLYELISRINEDEGKISFYNLPTVLSPLTFPNSNNIEPDITHYVKNIDRVFISCFETSVILLDLCERIETLYPSELYIVYEFYDLENKMYGSKTVFSNGEKYLKILFGSCPRVTVNTI
jgi:hypothetical protein